MLFPRQLKFILSIFAVISCLTIAPSLHAQFASGIEATVVDSTGASIPMAQLTLVNKATQVSQRAVTDSQGYVHILQLPPGTYRAEIKATGFKTWQLDNIQVEGHDIRTIYPKLAVGSENTTVTVTADAETVETTKGNIGRVLEAETMRESPMVGQDVYASVATLAPGVTGLGDASGNISAAGSVGTSSFNAEAGFQINAAGQRQEANEYQVDGTVVDGNSRDGVVNITPEPETIQEMKVTASTFSAEKGRQSGALIEIFTKPGTNRFHGMLSEFHADKPLTSRTEFQTEVPKYNRNDFGGTIGGPIIKDRTFFFGSLFWTRAVLGSTYVENVETPALRNWVASNEPNSIANMFLSQAPPAVDPTANFLTAAQVENNYGSTYAPPPIPSDLVVEGTSTINVSPIANGFQGHLRLDQNMSGGKDKVFFSLFRNTTQGETADGRPKYSYIAPNATLYAKFDYLHVFSPSLVNEAGMSYVRNTGSQSDKIPSLPNVYYIGGIDDHFSQWGPSSWAQNNFIYQDDLTYTHGGHTFHVGLNVDRQQDFDNFTNGLVRPYFYFLNVLDFASDHPFDQGGPVVDLATQTTAHDLYQRVMMLYVAPYIQDDWKILPRLTLNLGLRLDDFTHLATVENGQKPISFFTPGTGSTFAEQTANGSMQARGSNGAATTSARYRFVPRVGFAWDVHGNGTLSLHGGYGIFNDKVGEYAYVNNMRTNPPGYADPSLSIFNPGTTLANFSYGASSSGAQGFAPPPGLTYKVDSHGGLVGTRTQVGGIDPNLTPPLVHSWGLGLQQMVGGFVVELDYLGTASRNLFLQTDVNRFSGDYIVNNGTSKRLNQSFAGVIYGRSVGIANSNVGAFGISRHFSHGWTTHVTYTFSKSLDYVSSNDNGVGGGEAVFDAQHPERQYARSDYDARHRLSADAVWDIPGFRSGFLGTLTKGFTVSPIVILQSGNPYNIYTSATYSAGGDYNADGYGYDIPNAPAFGRVIHASRSNYLKGVFTASEFPAPTRGTEGNLGRNVYNGPGFAQTNIAVQRSFHVPILGDSGRLELRGEFLNAFNRVNLETPVGDLSNNLFGKSTGQYMPRQIQLVGHLRF
ncbi:MULTISPECIES: carboxypeptidase-like regulatory domain-containing protein [Acidobacteriaceae]|uniref:carboxypeptidase-like regulatory domain-containing protein n=1 Tax=Acidobacteriaceae TaxID=204434 RepID=UPI00131CA55A|nr:MULTISPECIES: carboxypeptidase-like regulatory domain-containing protein [Acidobacteriaceae]MDW5265997.1 carboxypeptidase regulatory-like domain-containing protein [Edaphobacter sp.]